MPPSSGGSRLRRLALTFGCALVGAALAQAVLVPRLPGWTSDLPAPGLMARLGASGGGEGGAGLQRTTYETLDVFENALALIRRHYLTEPEPERLVDGAVRGVFRALDEDSAYLDPDETDLYRRRAELAGDVGITLEKRYYLHVDGVLPGSPAEAAGVEPGTALAEIAGRNTREMQIPVGRLLLAGAPGSEVVLMARSSADAEPEEVRLERRRLEPAPVEREELEPGVGLVRIREFREGTAAEVAEAVRALGEAGADALVLDVRGSRGHGDWATALREVAGVFLADGRVARLAGRTEDGEEPPSEDLLGIPHVAPWTGALTVLANRSTAGPGELLAAAVAGERGSFVGGRTAGRTGAPELIEFEEGDSVLLSVRQYLAPDGEELLGGGAVPSVTPDDLDLDANTLDDDDPELDFALIQLRRQRGEAKRAA